MSSQTCKAHGSARVTAFLVFVGLLFTTNALAACGTAECKDIDEPSQVDERTLLLQLHVEVASSQNETMANEGSLLHSRGTLRELNSNKERGPNAQKRAELLKQRGVFLGVSRDGWMVIMLCITVPVLSQLLLLLAVSLCIERYKDIGIKSLAPGQEPPYPKIKRGWFQRVVLLSDVNSASARYSELALRAALTCAAFSVPYWIPSLAWVAEQGYSFQYVVVIIAFTLYTDVGTTTSLAWYNFYGTVLPTLNCLFMFGLFPNGSAAGEFSTAWWFGLVNLVLFIMLFICLEFPTCVRMFAISWQAYFSMCFLNPGNLTTFSPGFANIVFEGAEVGPLVATIIGCVVSILIVLPWYPFGRSYFNINRAQRIALDMAWREGRQWHTIVNYFSGRHEASSINLLVGEADRMRTKMNTLESCLASTWWECFDLGQARKVRWYLSRTHSKLAVIHDWLRGVLHAVAEEEFDEMHTEVMAMISEQVKALTLSVWRLIYLGVQLGIVGGLVNEDDRRLLLAAQKEVSAAETTLTEAFKVARLQVYGNDLYMTAVNEHFFLYALSSYCHYAMAYADTLLQQPGIDGQGPFTASLAGLRATFSFKKRRYILRASLSFFTAFYLGYAGISRVLTNFNSEPAATTAYLLITDSAGGSALVKLVARLQGTAGGTFLGAFLFQLVIRCSAGDAVSGAFATIFFQAISFYLYFSSTTYGYVGLLLSAYGAMSMMNTCAAGEQSSAEYFGAVVEQFIAVVSILLGDIVFAHISARYTATNSFRDYAQTIKAALAKILAPATETTVDLHREAFQEVYEKTSSLGEEASLEPYFRLASWKGELWSRTLWNTHRMALKLSLAEYASVDGFTSSGYDLPRDPAMADVMALASVKKLSAVVEERSNFIFDLSFDVLNHDSEEALLLKPQMLELLREVRDSRSGSNVFQAMAPDVVKEVSAAFDPEKEYVELVKDDLCQASTILFCLKLVMKHLDAVEQTVLQSFRPKDMKSWKA